jgi:DNA-binding MarR family transcriptional regulator
LSIDSPSPKVSLPEEEHAAALERILPEIARRMFTLAPNSPLAELPGTQLKVCSLLLDGRRTMGEIGEELRISTSAVSQIADRLEKTGLVERIDADGSGDRRTRYLSLTEQGGALLQARREHRTAQVADALSRIPEEKHAAIRAAFETLLAACRER